MCYSFTRLGLSCFMYIVRKLKVVEPLYLLLLCCLGRESDLCMREN